MDARLDAPVRPPRAWAALALPAAALLGWLVQRWDAVPVLAGLLAVLAAAAVLLRSEWATPAGVFLLYTNLPAVAHQLHGVPQAAAAGFLLLFALPLVPALLFRGARLRTDATLRWMMLYLAALLLSSLAARDQGIALDRVRTFVAEGLLLYWLVLNTVRSVPALRRVVWTALAAGSLLGALSLYQSATRDYDQQFGGLAQRELRFEDPQAVRAPGEYRRADRAAGPLGDENRFGQVMIVLLPLATLAYRRSRERRLRLAAAAAGVLVLAGVLLSYSRGAFVTLVLLLGAYALLRWARPSRIALGAAALALAVSLAAPAYLQRIATIRNATELAGEAPQENADATMRGRLTEMLAALHVAMDHPLLGVGPGQYAPFYSEEYQQNPDIKFRDIQKSRRAHTLYFELAAETGIVGLSLFMAAVGTLLRGLWRERRRWLGVRPLYADVATAFGLSLLAYLGTAVFLHLAYERYFWFLLALAGAALQLLRDAPVRRPRAARRPLATEAA
jgi:putative inorganic carbon (HCO3(-)) transporter